MIPESAIDAGELLATVDGTAYVRIAVVLARPDAGAIAYYCPAADWPTSLAGRLAARDAEIARLLAENERMAALLGGRTVLALPAPETPVEASVEAPADERAACPHCPSTFGTSRGLRVHLGRMHANAWVPEPVAEVVPEPEPPPAPTVAPPPPSPAPWAAARPELPADDPTWSCSSCGKRPGVDGAFSRSVTRPEMCFKCAAQANSTKPAAAKIAA